VILRACVRCGALSEQSRCPRHRRKPWGDSRRGEKTKLSGWAQQKRAKRVLALHDYVCHVCGGPAACEVDHVRALAEGGADDESNLRPIHGTCHKRKTAEEAARARATR
jgi:5-methylcytosine-specific restriction enzyme A